MEREGTPEEANCQLGPGPFLFSGKPPYVQGIVSLVNRSAEKVKVRSIVIGGAGVEFFRPRRLQTQVPAGQPEELLRVRVFGRLSPFDQANLPAELTIDKHTPPGEYEAYVRFRDQEAQARIYVLEERSLRLIPDQINIATAPGTSIKKYIYITNEGNVPFSTRKAAFAPLHALNMLHKSLAIALNEEGHKGYEKVLDRLSAELQDAEVQPAKVKIEIQDQEILPGETKGVEVTIQLPADLKSKRTYTSKISFRGAKLAVEVDVNGTASGTSGKTKGSAK